MGADLAAAGADLDARLPGRALAGGPRRARARPATITRPPSRPACSRPRTATSTSPRPASTSSSDCARRSAPSSSHQDPDFATDTARSSNRKRLNAEIGERTKTLRQPRAGRAPERGRRAVRADLLDRPDVRRPAGAAPRDGVPMAHPTRGRGGGRQPGREAVAHALRHRPPDARRSASTPRRCCRRSGTTRTRSRSFVATR